MHLASIDTEEENKLLQETIADQGLSPESTTTTQQPFLVQIHLFL
jgi:hypothetical protein